MKAPVNKLIPFSSVDGPGNRTSVFLQGCNFNCRYCHNPETRALCQNCGECVAGCPSGALSFAPASGENGGRKNRVRFELSRCIGCDHCIRVCRHNASPRIRWMEPAEVYAEVQKNIPFIRGVTVSGGECTLYPVFLRELGRLCLSDGLSYLLDSNGSYDFSEDSAGLLPYIDGVMLDVKAWSGGDHFRAAYVGNETVKKNMRYLAGQGKLTEVRTVVVPGLFDAEETVRETARALLPYLAKQPIRYKIIAYRPMGVREEYRVYQSPDAETLQRLAGIARQEGMEDIVLI